MPVHMQAAPMGTWPLKAAFEQRKVQRNRLRHDVALIVAEDRREEAARVALQAKEEALFVAAAEAGRQADLAQEEALRLQATITHARARQRTVLSQHHASIEAEADLHTALSLAVPNELSPSPLQEHPDPLSPEISPPQSTPPRRMVLAARPPVMPVVRQVSPQASMSMSVSMSGVSKGSGRSIRTPSRPDGGGGGGGSVASVVSVNDIFAAPRSSVVPTVLTASSGVDPVVPEPFPTPSRVTAASGGSDMEPPPYLPGEASPESFPDLPWRSGVRMGDVRVGSALPSEVFANASMTEFGSRGGGGGGGGGVVPPEDASDVFQSPAYSSSALAFSSPSDCRSTDVFSF